MATIRPELSAKNEYWIERHRYYELKHFCLQYPIWKKAYTSIDSLSKKNDILAEMSKTNCITDLTGRCAVAKAFYSQRIEMLEQIAAQTDKELSSYILTGITEGLSYDLLKARLEIPCGKDTYYNLYRRFFWLLNKARE